MFILETLMLVSLVVVVEIRLVIEIKACKHE